MPKYQKYNPVKLNKEINEVLKKESISKSELKLIGDKIRDYQYILPLLYKSSLKIKSKREASYQIQKSMNEKKFMFLVFGMMCNIASIFFLFVFFYLMIRKNNLKITR